MRVTAKMLEDAGWFTFKLYNYARKKQYSWVWQHHSEELRDLSHTFHEAAAIFNQQVAREASLDQLTAEAQRLGMYDLKENKQ